MPARNKVFSEYQRSSYRPRTANPQTKKTRFIHKRKPSPIIENRPEHEPHRYRTYLAIVFGTLCVIICICLAVLLPLLILVINRTSPSTDTSNSIYIDNSTFNNSSTTTLSSGTSISSSYSTTNSASVVTTGVGVTTTAAVTTGVAVTTSSSTSGFTASTGSNCATNAQYCGEHVTISCSVDLRNLTIVIIIQKTVNATYLGNTYSTFWGGTVNQTYVDTGSQIIYTWNSVPTQIIEARGSPYSVEAQVTLSGIVQPTSADTYSVVATTVTGITSTASGHF